MSKKMYEIITPHYNGLYAMVEKGQPGGWPYGLGDNYEECLNDARMLLGELEEVEENLFVPKKANHY